jgi:hypothetical protein
VKRAKLGTILGAAIALLLGAAPAHATDYFAAPADQGTADCLSSANACDVRQALQSATSSGDDVALAPGSYSPGFGPSLTVATGVTLHGAPGSRPVLNLTTASGLAGLTVTGTGAVRDVVVNWDDANGSAISVMGAGLLERVSAIGTGIGSQSAPCSLEGSATLRDTVCFIGGDSGNAQALDALGFAGNVTVTLVNVTAINESPTSPHLTSGIRMLASAGNTVQLNATNVIADSADAGSLDVRGMPNGGTTNATLVNSNYTSVTPAAAGVTITAPGTGTNEIVPPVFVDRAAGDFRQRGDSIGTIDKGIASGLGSFDFEGGARVFGAAPDIGADEITDVTATPVIPTPQTAGATSVSGTSTEADGTEIELYIDDVTAGTADVDGGTWLIATPALVAGQELTVVARAIAKLPSEPSAPVTVTPPPTGGGGGTPMPALPQPAPRPRCKKGKKLKKVKKRFKCVKKKKPKKR